MSHAVTVDDVVAMRPCGAYPRDRIVHLFAGRETLSPDDIAALPIPRADRLWTLLRMAPREVWMPAIFACAERAIRSASWSLYRRGRVEASERLEFLPPIVDRASARAAADAAYAAADAAYAAYAAADAEGETTVHAVAALISRF